MKLRPEDMRLYAVTARVRARNAQELLEQVALAAEGGATIIQLREKNIGDGELLREARAFAAICREKRVISIINDRPDIAVAAGADGVHVGQDDLEAVCAREILGPDRILGVSAHNVEEALRAEAAGADYLGVGAAFQTGTKSDAKPISHAIYREITRAVRIPVVAIGGINRDNILELSGLGLSGAAVVSALFGAQDICAAAREMRALAERIAGESD